jgi:hypothetical protein
LFDVVISVSFAALRIRETSAWAPPK